MRPTYDPEAVKPMIEELTNIGIESLETAEDVDRLVSNTPGTTLLVINSVCGCAAGSCRPGVVEALQNKLIPDNLGTVFAGVQMEAVERARALMPDVQPSSPNVAIFKDGDLIGVLQRQHIEQMDANGISAALVKVFDEHCKAEGPSVAPEVADENEHVDRCGSSIPMYNGE
ncbi:MAG: BrxA/BrxB family bacilliredoxin [Candidatus Hydrogenedentota bacterium]